MPDIYDKVINTVAEFMLGLFLLGLAFCATIAGALVLCVALGLLIRGHREAAGYTAAGGAVLLLGGGFALYRMGAFDSPPAPERPAQAEVPPPPGP